MRGGDEEEAGTDIIPLVVESIGAGLKEQWDGNSQHRRYAYSKHGQSPGGCLEGGKKCQRQHLTSMSKRK